MRHRTWLLWILWLTLSGGLAIYMTTMLYGTDSDKRIFLPGETSDGHYQIELACSACHTSAFADQDDIQKACENCHAAALKEAKDNHPKSKFTDPRNADRIALLDARYCANCHVEHRPEVTLKMGLTVPQDYCFLCHSKIAEDRPSHAGMAFTTCANAGCHNFHDNRSLYEDFLAKHLDDPATKQGKMLSSNFRQVAAQIPNYPLKRFPLVALTLEDKVAPPGMNYDHSIDREWLASSHAAAGVNCTACHESRDKDGTSWIDRPGHTACVTCHAGEVAGFLQGKHGMRLDKEKLGRELTPMTPRLARLPMKRASLDRELNCQSCHAAHAFDSASAAVQSCLGCHNDRHSLAYDGSPHYDLWMKERSGELPKGSGVTCATCHMPRIEKDYFWGAFTHNLVQHNQSDTLRPNEKMLRPVCMKCHGLGFAIDALADEALIEKNFTGQPSIHVESMDLVRRRLTAK